MNTTEIYISLGCQGGTHFYLHTIYASEKFEKVISYQIYNVLIHERVITDVNDIAVIFDVDPIHRLINVVTIQHEEANQHTKFEKSTLEQALPTLLRVKLPAIYTIQYDYDIKGYRTYLMKVDTSTINMDILVSQLTTTINSITEVTTSNPIS